MVCRGAGSVSALPSPSGGNGGPHFALSATPPCSNAGLPSPLQPRRPNGTSTLRYLERDHAEYAKLAQQITGSDARSAFMSSSTLQRSGAHARPDPAASVPSSPAMPMPAGAASAEPVSDALIAQCVPLLAELIGPIARVVAKQAAARYRQRAQFFAALGDAVVDPGKRARLLAELAKLR